MVRPEGLPFPQQQKTPAPKSGQCASILLGGGLWETVGDSSAWYPQHSLSGKGRRGPGSTFWKNVGLGLGGRGGQVCWLLGLWPVLETSEDRARQGPAVALLLA